MQELKVLMTIFKGKMAPVSETKQRNDFFVLHCTKSFTRQMHITMNDLFMASRHSKQGKEQSLNIMLPDSLVTIYFHKWGMAGSFC